MDLRTLLTIVVKRWIVVIPTIVVAVLVGQRLLGSVEPEYEAKGSQAVLTSTTAARNVPSDPYLDLPASLRSTAHVFSTIMNGDAQKRVIASHGGTTHYDVTVDHNAPILHVTARANQPGVAVATVKAVMDATRQQIDFRESRLGVGTADRVRTDVLSSPTHATTVNAAKTRALIALIALGVAAVLSVALLVESWMQAAQRTRDRRPLKVAAPPEMFAEPAPFAEPATPPSPPAAERTGAELPDGLIGAARDVEGREPDEDEIDLTVDDQSTPSTTAARQPGRARAKPRRRSGTSS